jgi:FdhE protein
MEPAEKNNNLANFYLALVDLQEKLASHRWLGQQINVQDEKWLQGEPILSLLPPVVPVELARQVVDNVVTATLEWQPGPEVLEQSTAAALTSLGDADIEDFIQTAIKNAPLAKQQWITQLNISEQMLDFLTLNIAKPILTAYGAAVVKKIDLEQWHKGHCPVCGESPVMAKLTGKYGVRMLHCGRCETEWGFDRLGCPFCGNKDSNKLCFITPETHKQYRLYLCDECKTYLKTVDERQCGEVDLFCEDLATADFDTLAAAEGYRRGNKRYRV